jgi:hypothetical protein
MSGLSFALPSLPTHIGLLIQRTEASLEVTLTPIRLKWLGTVNSSNPVPPCHMKQEGQGQGLSQTQDKELFEVRLYSPISKKEKSKKHYLGTGKSGASPSSVLYKHRYARALYGTQFPHL